MISNLVIIIIIIYSFGIYSVLTNDLKLIQTEQDLIYSRLKTRSDLELFYETLLKSNDLDDIKHIQHVVNQDDVRKLDLTDKVEKN